MVSFTNIFRERIYGRKLAITVIVEKYQPNENQPDYRGFEWYHLWRLTHTEQQLINHGSNLSAIAISPDGRLIASGGSDGAIKLWEKESGRLFNTIEGRAGSIRSLAFSPEGSKIVASSSTGIAALPRPGDGGAVKIWNVAAGQELLVLQTGAVSKVKFSPDGSKLVTGGFDAKIKLWDVASGKELMSLEGHQSGISDIAFSPNGKLIASGSGIGRYEDRPVRVWDITSRKELPALEKLTISWGTQNAVAFSPDSRMLSATFGSSIQTWNLETGKHISSFDNKQAATSLALSPDGQRLASGSSRGVIKLWDLRIGDEIASIQGHHRYVSSVSFTPDAGQMVSGSTDGIKVWDSNVSQSPLLFSRVSTLAFSPDQNLIAIANTSGTIKVWNMNSGLVQWSATTTGGDLKSLVFSSDGKMLVSSGRPIKIWDVATGNEIDAVNNNGGWPVVLSPDNNKLAWYNEPLKQVIIWDLTARKELFSFKGFDGPTVFGMSFSTDNRTLIIADGVGPAEIWDTNTGKQLATLNTGYSELSQAFSMAFSSDGKWLATADIDGTAKLWDTASWQETDSFRGHTSGIRGVAFISDNRRLVTAGEDKIKLWDLATGQEIMILQGDQDYFEYLRVSPDGSQIAGIDPNKHQIRIWQAATNDEAEAWKVGAHTQRQESQRWEHLSSLTNSYTPNWWFSGSDFRNFESGAESSTRRTGHKSIYLKAKVEKPQGFNTLMQSFKANNYRGKRIKLSGYLKTENAGLANLWMRVDGDRRILSFDNMINSNRAIRNTTDWQKYDIVLDVPENSLMISFGFMLSGQGKVWADEFTFEIVDQTIPVTHHIKQSPEWDDTTRDGTIARVRTLPARPTNLGFEIW